jgi:tape measure domain-containing protein
MAQIEDILLRLEADTTRLRMELRRAGDQVDDFEDRTRRRMGDYDTTMRRITSSVEGAFRRHGLAIGATAVAVGAAVNAIAKAGDEYTRAVGKISAATGSLESAKTVYDDLAAVSTKTGAAMADTTGAFVRFGIAAKQIGATNRDVVRLIQTVQELGVVSGASTQEMAAGSMQLGQALASGKLQGDELRSILENMPKLAELLAAELGVSIGKLREMGKEGELSADRVFTALLRVSDEADKLFAAIPQNMERASGALSSSWDRFLVKLDEGLGLSQGIAKEMQAAAKALDAISGAPRSVADQIADIERGLRGGGVRGAARTDMKDQLAYLRMNEAEMARMDALLESQSEAQRKARAETEAHTKALDAFGKLQDDLLTPMEKARKAHEARMKVIEDATAAGADAADIAAATADAEAALAAAVGRTAESRSKGTVEANRYVDAAADTLATMQLQNDALQLRLSGQDRMADLLAEEARWQERLGPLYAENAERLRELWDANRGLTEQMDARTEAERQAERTRTEAFHEQQRVARDYERFADRIAGDLAGALAEACEDFPEDALSDPETAAMIQEALQ